jgi:predicted ATP-dependent Lon-type protease
MSDIKTSGLEEIKRKIRVKLDSKTIIVLSDITKLSFWKTRYPKAVVLD